MTDDGRDDPLDAEVYFRRMKRHDDDTEDGDRGRDEAGGARGRLFTLLSRGANSNQSLTHSINRSTVKAKASRTDCPSSIHFASPTCCCCLSERLSERLSSCRPTSCVWPHVAHAPIEFVLCFFVLLPVGEPHRLARPCATTATTSTRCEPRAASPFK